MRTKLFKAFLLLILLFGLLSAYVGIHVINRGVIDEASRRVQLDMGSAWAVCNSKLEQMETIVKLVALKEFVIDSCANGNWTEADLKTRLERIRTTFNLDFLDLISPEGQVMVRTTPPYRRGDTKASNISVESARKGEPMTSMGVLTASELEQEGDGLADRAFIEIAETPHARLSERKMENRGMVMESAVPIRRGMQIIGIVHGGILLNRNHELVDKIQNVVFKNETYEGKNVGTVTIFLNDVRISTTVRLANKNRALGTRVSKQVADRVLDNGQPWVGEAPVVDETYLTAYDPIKDGRGQIIGMLYVGILKKPFEAMGREVIMRFVLVTLIVMVVALGISFITASRIARPIHRLVEASNQVSNGNRNGPVKSEDSCHEVSRLILAFNEMTSRLWEREERLKALNRSYMETLGFVSHELKSPVATILNYVFLLRAHKLGGLNEKQDKAVKSVERNSHRLVEMVRHYLNLSRIENGELTPVRTRVLVLDEVVKPLIESVEAGIEEKQMKVEVGIDSAACVHADLNMVREVFENLVSNAIKYGKEAGRIVCESRPRDGLIEFTVRNEGEGIPPEKMGRLFQKFSRLESSAETKSQRGTGLGLFITKSIVEAHGGAIEVKSEGQGWTAFIFTLPACGAGEAK